MQRAGRRGSSITRRLLGTDQIEALLVVDLKVGQIDLVLVLTEVLDALEDVVKSPGDDAHVRTDGQR